MGSALGASWLAEGHDVATSLRGRSARTLTLARDAGLMMVDSLEELVEADVIVSVVPPAAALPAARAIAAAAVRSTATPLTVDLNAVSPMTLMQIVTVLRSGRLDLVDGAISGPPPQPGPARTTLYFSGERAPELSMLSGSGYRTVILSERAGAASALKMSTSSMYKGMNALVLQALVTASHFGVLDAFIEDVSAIWPDDVPHWPWHSALAASKSDRFVDEMREIAATQAEAGLPSELFHGVAEAFAHISDSELARSAPESIERSISLTELLDRLR
jgi:3-hydroxyisobutyrate dehydrogenase-like beta-hydroxyacid dehydrogenase